MRTRKRNAVPSATEPDLSADGIFCSNVFPCLEPTSLVPGTLYIVSTPVGDPEDISIRALRVLKSVTIIAAENPRRTRVLLQCYGIATPVTGYRNRGDGATIPGLLSALRSGDTTALVCDAGTPLIADAGVHLVRAALNAGVTLKAVPGSVAAMAALVLAGAAEQRFAFDGFPPRARALREAYFAALADEQRTILLYETRRFLADTVRRLRDSLGAGREILIARDLTKAGEALYYGVLGDAAQRVKDPPPGEYALVISRSRRVTGFQPD